MATPRNVSRTTTAGTKLRAGRFTPAYINLVDQIAAAAPNSWVKVNLNRYQDVWEDPAFRAQYSNDLNPTTHAQAGGSSPFTLLGAWCCVALDDERQRLILWGGGHANGSNNEVYSWNGDTQTWNLAYHAHSVRAFERTNPGGGIRHRSIAGSKAAPISSHTYSNQVWLPRLQRFFTAGGGAYNTGGPFMVVDESDFEVRQGGPFTLDMTLAGQGYTSTRTGDNPKRTGTISEGVNLPGANAWSMRDYRLDHPNTTVAAKVTGGRTLCVTEENGHDVVYMQGGDPGATSKDLIRIEMVDHDYRNDLLSIVGAAWSNGVSDVQAAFHPTRKLFFNPSYNPADNAFIGGWDVSPGKAGSQNRYFLCPTTGLSGPAKDEFVASAASNKYGNIYDKRRDRFVVFSRAGALFEMQPPAGTDYSTGWAVKKIAGATEFAPMGTYEADSTSPGDSLCGRFKRSERLDVYVLVTHIYDGNIWMYKPHDWLDPRNA